MMPEEPFTPTEAMTFMLQAVREGMEETLRKLESKRDGTPEREIVYRFGTALVRILGVTATWNETRGLRIMSVDQACDDILKAMEEALSSIPGWADPPAGGQEAPGPATAP